MAQNVFAEFLKHFSGLWNFERSISKPALHIKGAATFKKLSENTLSYHEYGTYTVDEIAYDFFQKRIFSYDMNVLTIYKSDHSLLHKFDFESNHTSYPITLNHTHLCGQDIYKCTLIVKAEQCFDIHYKISGTNKDYEITTRYTKD
ncbi:MAG: DUF6314 family protein [Pseudomonadota bacterium]